MRPPLLSGVLLTTLALCAPGAEATPQALGLLAQQATSPDAPPPRDLLDAGREAFHAGEHAAAARFLESALAAGLVGSDRSDALHLLGLALLDEGDPAEAERTLVEAIQAAREVGRAPLRDLLNMARARALDAQGRHAEAAELYGEVAGDPWSSEVVEAGWLRALALEASGDHDAARRALKGFLRRWPDAVQGHDARLRLAHLERAEGDVRRAVALYREVIRYSPKSRASQESRKALDELATEGREAAALSKEDRVAWLEWLTGERRFEAALPELEGLLTTAAKVGDGELEVRATQLLAFALRETGQTERALELYRWLEARDERSTSAERLAWMLASLGRFEEAEAELLDGHRGRRTRRYWIDLAELREAFGRYEQAGAAWRKARRSARWNDARIDREIAWCTLWQGAHDEALELLHRVEARQPSYRRWARYWQARTLQEAGREEEAVAGFRALASDAPLTYYGIQAGSRLAELEGSVPGHPEGPSLLPSIIADATGPGLAALFEGFTSPNPFASPDPARRSTLRWPRSIRLPRWEEAPRPASRSGRLAALERFSEQWGPAAPEADRALALERLGFTEAARDELRVVDTDYRVYRWRGWRGLVGRGRSDMLDNRRAKKSRGGADVDDLGRRGWQSARRFGRAARSPDFLRDLRQAEKALADPWATRRSAVAGGGPGSPSEATTSPRWREAYPIAWAEPMAKYTARHDVPAYFLYGVMTVESAFHAHAVSVAHAYGLLQMIPRTGRRVAEELGYEEFSPERLLDPEISIYMSSYYMGRLLDRFRGQEPLAAAAYNAGPHRVSAWLDANPDRPMDAFLEEIPFTQARHYARSVLRHTARYRRVYHDEPLMYVSNELDPDHLAAPNY